MSWTRAFSLILRTWSLQRPPQAFKDTRNRTSNLNPHLFSADFARKNFGAWFFAATRAVFQANVPAVPAADDLSILNHTFAERKTHMRAKIFDGINAAFILTYRDADAISLHGSP